MKNKILKNKIYLMNFPDELEIQPGSLRYYDVYKELLPLDEFVLCTAHAVVLYMPSIDEADKKFLYHKNGEPRFFNGYHRIDDMTIKILNDYQLDYFDEIIGRQRIVNPRQFEIIEGSIVRSKVDAKLGAGLVTHCQGDLCYVRFPKAIGYYSNEIVKCHVSNLRVVSHIEEVKSET